MVCVYKVMLQQKHLYTDIFKTKRQDAMIHKRINNLLKYSKFGLMPPTLIGIIGAIHIFVYNTS